MTIAEQIAQMLVSVGIRRVYGLPGEDHMALLDSLSAAGLEYCAAFNESSAVIMAATDGQLTGLPGVAVLSLAPGISNGINGLLNTFLEEVPLLLISGQHPAGQLPFVVRQGFNIEQLVTPATKWRARVTADMNVPAVIGKAIDEAMSGRPGPVYLEIPDAVATSESTASAAAANLAVTRLTSRWPGRDSSAPTEAGTTRVAVVRPGAGPAGADQPSADRASAADWAATAALADRLGGAQRPVLVLGGRQRRVRPETVVEFAARFRIPVFTSSRQKGVLDSSSAYFAGTFLNGRLEKDLLDRADLVVLIDPESFDFYNKAWCFSAEAVAITASSFTEWLNPVALTLAADPETVLTALLAAGGGADSQWTPADVAGYRSGLRAKLLPAEAATFSVAHAVDAALDAWPRDGYLTADAGFSKPIIAMLSDPAEPDHYLASNALSTMGYSIPAAVAARRAGAGPLLAFLGDGSLLMRATEIMVSAQAGPPVVYVAIMDRSLTQIEVKQERRNLAAVGVTLPPISCAKLADAFGIDGVDIDNADELRAAVAKGLADDRPVLIGAHVDPAPSRVLFDLLRG
ncbi:MAG TPA: thiamine pyrophosphate-binding protein [Streptosporangiaceae bacterium]|nr:thiamine pyrophosphate-binding protein [Streptosporangiaceae bacterium]